MSSPVDPGGASQGKDNENYYGRHDCKYVFFLLVNCYGFVFLDS